MMKKILIILIVGIAVVFLILFFFPVLFAKDNTLTIYKKETLSAISSEIKNKKIIPSIFLFKVYMKVTHKDKKIIPGDYLFSNSESIVEVANRISRGDYRMEQKRIVIPEGSSIKDIAAIIIKTYPKFDSKNFVLIAKPYEGYLFPDSYELFESTSTTAVLQTLRSNFDFKTKDLVAKTELQHKKWKYIIILASLIEEEGKTPEDRKIISGILNNRLASSTPLQVDSAFQYVNGKISKDLTLNDLKINSPYNTYIHVGLPPTPISSPGLESIDAALNPAPTDFQYFLTGTDGQMYYAKTFEEHLRNKRLYIK